MSEWRLISDIPPIDEVFIATDGKHVSVCMLDESLFRLSERVEFVDPTFRDRDNDMLPLFFTPTHWQPLPDPPK